MRARETWSKAPTPSMLRRTLSDIMVAGNDVHIFSPALQREPGWATSAKHAKDSGLNHGRR
eukprot:5098356-Pyramimonas_sp.AAC.1